MSARRFTRVDTVVLAMIAIHLVVRAWIILPGGFLQDDYVILADARERGLSTDYLFQSYNGHVMPGGFFLTWVVASLPSNNFLVAAVILLLMQLAVSLAVWLMLRKAVGPHPGIVVGAAIFLFTPLSLAYFTWWAAAINYIPLQLALCLGAYAVLRYREDRSFATWAMLLGSLLLGMLFWEKAVVIPVFMVMAVLMTTPGSIADRVRGAWRLRGLWFGLATFTLVYLAAYLTAAEPEGQPVSSWADLVEVTTTTLKTFATGALGGPWTGSGMLDSLWPDPAGGVLFIVALVVAGLLAWSVVSRGPQVLVAWGALVVYLVVDLFFTVWGRGDWLQIAGLDPRYIGDALPVLALVVAVVIAQPLRYAAEPARAEESRSTGSAPLSGAVAVGSALLVVSSLVTTAQMSDHFRRTDIASFVDKASASVRSSPSGSVADIAAPAWIMTPFFLRESRVSTVLSAYGVQMPPARPRQDLQTLNDDGELSGFDIASPSTTAPMAAGDRCGLNVALGTTRVGRVAPAPPDGPLVMRIEYYSGQAGRAQVKYGAQSQSVPIEAGVTKVDLAVDGSAQFVSVTNLTTPSSICVVRIQVGRPSPVS